MTAIKAFIPILLLMADLAFCGVTIKGKPDAALDKSINEGMDLLYKENFSAAIRIFTGIKDKYPWHPIGYFLMAAALDAKMYFYYSNFLEAEFMKNCEKSIEIGEALLQKEPNDKWLLFFVGGSYGTMGVFQARYKNYISAFRNGWTGVSLLKQIYAMDPAFSDVLYGLGTYHYWSSRFSKALWWMPGLRDERATGIQQLEKCIETGEYTKLPSGTNLLRIFIEEERYDDAIKLAERYLKLYPNNRFFLFGMAEAHYLSGNIEEAERIFTYILDLVDSEEFNNNVNALRLHAYLAKIFETKKLWYKSVAECRRAKAFKFNETDKLVAQEFLEDVNKTLGRVVKNYPLAR
jgi:tetratricopeptide (TPR) repeat protein